MVLPTNTTCTAANLACIRTAFVCIGNGTYAAVAAKMSAILADVTNPIHHRVAKMLCAPGFLFKSSTLSPSSG